MLKTMVPVDFPLNQSNDFPHSLRFLHRFFEQRLGATAQRLDRRDGSCVLGAKNYEFSIYIYIHDYIYTHDYIYI